MDFKAKYFDLWKIAWAFHQKWYDNGGSEAEWDSIVSEAGTLMSKSDFSKDLTLTVIGELERVDKEKRKAGENNG